jgi:group II intron reverse transcriptase/maturase
MINLLIKLYLTSFNGNVDMRCRTVNQLSIRRSESTVVGIEKDDTNRQSLNEPCEVTQSQRITKKASALLNPLEKKLDRASRSLKKTFTLDKLVAAMTSYENIVINAEQQEPLNKLYELLCNPCFLLIAYDSVKKNAAAGLDNVAGSNVTLTGLRTLSKELFSEQYKCIPVRRLYIDKPQGGKRPLGVPSTRDKIVQKALLMLLQPTFEHQFSAHSHGFRPNKSCHTALRAIRKDGNRTTWFIELDLVKAFDKIQHSLLMEELKTRIADLQILDLIHKMLKVGYINPHDLSDGKLEMEEGTPQGSILSPFFANVLFDRFDRWVETNLLIKYNILRKDSINSEYAKAVNKHFGTEWNEVLESIKKHAPDVCRKKIRLALREVRKQQTAQNKIKYDADDSNHRKLWYVRYADDMLLGLIGPKKDAQAILKEIETAVDKELKMQIHPEKSGVKHHSDGVLFLGYRLLGNYDSKFNFGESQRRLSNRIKFSVPTKRLLKRYMNKGFLQRAKKGKNVKYVARRVDKWIFLPSDAEVVKRFNSILRGIAEYYCGTEFPSALYELWVLFKRSLSLTLAHRHKKRTAKAGFQKWGHDLVVNYEVEVRGKIEKRSVQFEVPKITYGKFKRPGALEGEFLWLMRSTTPEGAIFPKTLSGIVSANELPCSIPHCPNFANEWHHVTSRKKAKRKNLRAIEVAYKLRQIPVCSAHHTLITSGKYDGPSLRKLPSYDAGNVPRNKGVKS